MDVAEMLRKIDLNEDGNKVNLLYKKLRNLIISGELKENTTLPNENNMCEILSVGRGTLREVYKMLQLDGYIERSKAGTVINGYNKIAENGSFDSSLGIGDQDDLIEFLLIVEPEAAGIAAKKKTDAQLKKIYDAMMSLEKANTELDIEKMNEYNSLFHRLIREACQNAVLISSITNSKKRFEEIFVRRLLTDSESSRQFMDLCLFQHYNLYFALKTQDQEKARAIMKEHLLSDIDYYRIQQD